MGPTHDQLCARLQHSTHLPNLKSLTSSVPEILKEFEICRETNTGHWNDTVHRAGTVNRSQHQNINSGLFRIAAMTSWIKIKHIYNNK